MSQGYIKLHRQLQECWVWQGERFSRGQAWVDLLMMANHKDVKIPYGERIEIVKRGQFITSIAKLADRWSWSFNTVKKFLNLLENDNMLIRKSDNSKTLITIVNYDIYQCSEDKKTSDLDRPIDRPANRASADLLTDPLIPNNNDKECIKNDKKNKYADDDELNRAILDFIDHRRKLRKPMTDKAVKLFIDRLNRLAESPRHQVTLINEAISRGWQTVYPVDGQSEQQALNKQKSKNRLKDLEKYYLQKVGDE